MSKFARKIDKIFVIKNFFLTDIIITEETMIGLE